MKVGRMLCLATMVLALGAGVAACGGSDDKGGGGSAKLDSCKQLCDKQAAAMCPISVPADVCKQLCDVYGQAPAACQDAVKAASDCQLAQSNVCSSTGCQTQQAAYQNACK